jgi:hypothetical protein
VKHAPSRTAPKRSRRSVKLQVDLPDVVRMMELQRAQVDLRDAEAEGTAQMITMQELIDENDTLKVDVSTLTQLALAAKCERDAIMGEAVLHATQLVDLREEHDTLAYLHTQLRGEKEQADFRMDALYERERIGIEMATSSLQDSLERERQADRNSAAQLRCARVDAHDALENVRRIHEVERERLQQLLNDRTRELCAERTARLSETLASITTGGGVPGDASDATGGAPVCAVCLESLTPGVRSHVTPCGHLFHTACVDRAICRTGPCPTCRSGCRRSHLIRVYL